MPELTPEPVASWAKWALSQDKGYNDGIMVGFRYSLADWGYVFKDFLYVVFADRGCVGA